MPQLRPLPAAEYGIDLARLALVPDPGEQWPSGVAALIDGIDIVIVATPADVPATTARPLMARARQRGRVLVSTRAWPGCDLTCGWPAANGTGWGTDTVGCAVNRCCSRQPDPAARNGPGR